MIEFRVLGPIEAVDGSHAVALGRGKERSLLAVLLLHANEVVSIDRLVDELWPQAPPGQAAKAVQAYVSRLRSRLGEGVVLTRTPGYVLVLEPDQLDLHRFERLVGSARDAPPEQAASLLRDALALFRGPVLADVAYEHFAQGEIARIDGLRLEALEARIAADLACGADAGLVPELELLVREHPNRERLRAHLATALYRAGRQVDALGVVREGRRTLADELGLEPGEELRALERSILVHDPALAAPAGSPTEAVDVPEPRRSKWRRVAGAAAVAVAALVAAVVVVTRLDGPAAAIVASPNSVAVIDAERNAVTAVIPLPERPLRVAAHGDDVWILHPDAAALTRVTRSGRRVSRTLGLGGAPDSLAADATGVWVSDALAGTVTHIDAERPDVRRQFGVRPGPVGLAHSDAGALALGFGALWFASGRATVTRIDPQKLVGRGSIRVERTAGPGIGGIATSAGAVWVGGLHEVTRVDPRTNGVEAVVNLGVFRVSGLAASPEGAWVSDVASDQVFLVDAARSLVAGATKVGAQPLGVAYAAGSVWVANSGDGTVSRIDAATGRLVATIHVGGSPAGIAVVDDEVWVTVA